MGTRKPSDDAARTAPDDPDVRIDERAARRRRRADEAGLQALVRRLATDMSSDGGR